MKHGHAVAVVRYREPVGKRCGGCRQCDVRAERTIPPFSDQPSAFVSRPLAANHYTIVGFVREARDPEHLLLSDVEKDARRAAGNARMKELAFSLAAELSRRG